MTDISDRIAEILTQRFEVDPAALSPGASFDDLDLDSLAQVEFGEMLGETFGVDIGADELANLSTLAEVAALIRDKGVTV